MSTPQKMYKVRFCESHPEIQEVMAAKVWDCRVQLVGEKRKHARHDTMKCFVHTEEEARAKLEAWLERKLDAAYAHLHNLQRVSERVSCLEVQEWQN